MPLNPLGFDSQESFEKALMEAGLRRGWTPLKDSVEDLIDKIIEHHGIKGMKWGVRKASTGPRAVAIKDKKKKIKTSGGGGHPAHPDAVRARTIGQVGKASGLKSLSNQDLEAYARRLNLEQNVTRLNYNEKSAPKKFISSLLGRQGSQLANEATKRGAGKAGRSALNKATRKSARVARVAATVAMA